jgi:hypothetical protein
MSTESSGTGYRYHLILRGECGPLVAELFGEAAVETGHGWTRVIFSVRDDAELYRQLDQIQDFALHLVSLEEVGSTAAVPDERQLRWPHEPSAVAC